MCAIENDTHKWQAGSVKGMHGGKLMCETRLESRESRTNYSSERHESSGSRQFDNHQQRVRMRGSGPRDSDEWMLVRRKSNTKNDTRETMRTRGTRQHPGGN